MKSLLDGVAVAAVLLILAIVIDILGTTEVSGEVWKALILWFAHIMTMMSFFAVLDLTKLRKLAPTILLLLEGFTFLVGFQSIGKAQFMYGMWGMYFQSKWHYGETGVTVLASLIAEGILFVFSYLAGRVLLGREPLNEWK